MAAPQNVIALIFDFDDTLTPDSTNKLLHKYGIDTKEFWEVSVKKLVDDEWDPTLAYLNLILENIGEGNPLGKLTNKQLREFGATLDFYQGIPDIFDSLRKIVAEHTLSHPSIEFYIVSGGLEEIIRGSKVAKFFDGIWGCRFSEKQSQIAAIKNVISFTEKTKYIFSINKGLNKKFSKNQFLVNEYFAKEDRRIPFHNMIYVGDGLTDVPCFSLLNQYGGYSFGVFDPTMDESPRKGFEKLLAPSRTRSLNSPKYNSNDELGSLIRAAVRQICLNMDLRLGSAI